MLLLPPTTYGRGAKALLANIVAGPPAVVAAAVFEADVVDGPRSLGERLRSSSSSSSSVSSSSYYSGPIARCVDFAVASSSRVLDGRRDGFCYLVRRRRSGRCGVRE